MNVSRIVNTYNFKDFSNEMFKLNSQDNLPIKFSESFRYCNDNSRVRLFNEWILSINRNNMIIWKYLSADKHANRCCREYFLPNSELVYSPNHAAIIFDQPNSAKNTTGYPRAVFAVGDDATVRFWPDIACAGEYVDQKIANIHGDRCLSVEQISNDALVIVWASMRITVADLKDVTEAGITFRHFSPHGGLMSGLSRCLSYFVQSYNSNNYQNASIIIKSNNCRDEDVELLLLVDNCIDSFRLDVLHNGKYTKAIINTVAIKKAVFEKFNKRFQVESEQLMVQLKNFDLCNNICYMLVEITDPVNETHFYFLVTYNRNIESFDCIAEINSEFEGEMEIMVIKDKLKSTGQPCLLTAVRDSNKILIVEVLTGIIKAKFDASNCLESKNCVNSKQAIIGWSCPKLSYKHNVIVVAITTTKELVFIKQKIDPYINESSTNRMIMETNLSNASLNEMNASVMDTDYPGDMYSFNNSFASKNQSFFKRDKTNLQSSILGSRNLSNLSEESEERIEECDMFGEFKKCVKLFWLGYKTQANRSMINIIDSSKNDPEISIPFYTMQIVREIIDECPKKDPRWSKFNDKSNRNEFCYSNESLILSQQLASKHEALDKLVLMLKENNFNCVGTMGNIAPFSVSKCLFTPETQLDSNLFGDFKVSWSVANCVGFGGELLEFVRVLNEIMLNTTSLEINRILSKTCSNILIVQKKMGVLEIFSQQVSLVPMFINNCSIFLNELRDGLSDLNNLDGNNMSEQTVNIKRFCQLLSRIISKCLRASLLSRKRFETSFLSSHFDLSYLSSTTSAPCWITENSPIGVSESIFDLIVNLLELSRNIENDIIFESIFEIVSVYLDCFRHRINWMENFSKNQTELERIYQCFNEIRYQLIEKLVEDEKCIEKALDLAERYEDYHWITALCELLDSQSVGSKTLRLDVYLKKFYDDGFSEFVLNWYQEKLKGSHPNHRKFLAKIQLILEKIQKLEGTNMSTRMENSNSSMVIEKFLDREEIQTTRWLHEIEVENFEQAAKTLFRLGETEEALLGRKKSLLSVARLSSLAADNVCSEEDMERIMEESSSYLKLIQFQENIPSKIISSELGYSSDHRYQPIIGVPQLVKLFLLSSKTDDNSQITQIIRALELIKFSRLNLEVVKLSISDLNNLLLIIWSQIILFDNWSLISNGDVKETVLSKVFKASSESGFPVEDVLPDMEQLFNERLLEEISQNQEIVYVIKRSFETLSLELASESNGHWHNDMDIN